MNKKYPIIFEVGDTIGIRNIYDLPPELIKALTEKIGVHVNPEIAIKQNMNLSIWGIPKKIFTRNICMCPDGSYTAYFERGLIEDIKQEINDYNLYHPQPDKSPTVFCSKYVKKIWKIKRMQ